MDFTLLLSILLLVTGATTAADRWIWAPRRRAIAGPAARPPPAIEYSRAFFPLVCIVLVIRSFVAEPFRIPSASMMPGLVDGDFIFVNKFAYGLRLPLIDTLLVPVGKPRRGDVVVFRLPSDPATHYIKRLMGLPGDHVVVHENRILLNGRPLPQEPAGVYEDGYGFSGSPLARERIDAGEHLIMLVASRPATDFDAVVPAGHYFFMGDNRNDSQDSRFEPVGFVPERNIVGRAALIWLNWQVPGSPRWERVGTLIH